MIIEINLHETYNKEIAQKQKLRKNKLITLVKLLND